MSETIPFKVRNEVPDSKFIAAVVVAKGVKIAPAPEGLVAELDALIEKRKTLAEFPEPSKKEAIRSLLKRGGFKASGRNKPASEYLGQAAREGRFPRINNLVDINNLLSLELGLPISLLDGEVVGSELVLRYGREGEKYIFNQSGQEIDLKGLITMCSSADVALGNAVKDSMQGKLKDHTTSVVGVIYAATDAIDRGSLGEASQKFAHYLKIFGGAELTWSDVVGG